MPLKILLVDDHIMITDFYKTALSNLGIETEITSANTLKIAYHLVFNINITFFDIIILDIRMPSYLEKEINNGEDLAKLIRVKYPKIKIIIITGYCESARLNSINKYIYPEGILEKSNINYNIFIDAFKLIVDGNTYFSETVKKSFNDKSYTSVYLDSTNRKIIDLLSRGVKTINIPQHLPISLSGVNKRKQKIKEILQIESGNDEDIIRECRTKGIIE